MVVTPSRVARRRVRYGRLNAVQQLGATLGIAVLGSVFLHTLTTNPPQAARQPPTPRSSMPSGSPWRSSKRAPSVLSAWSAG
jgi:hypothetical protein